MISNVTSKYQTNYNQLTKAATSFAGAKDILLIDDEEYYVDNSEKKVKRVLGEKADEYTIHKAIGGKAGLKKAKKIKPLFTITAYNMHEWLPYGVDLIKALKKVGTKVIIVTSNWYQFGIESMKAGAKKCEEEAGADKYIYDFEFEAGDFNNSKDYDLYSKHYTRDDVLKESVEAMINGKPIPKYPFQEEVEKETNK